MLKPKKTITSSPKAKEKVKLNRENKVAGHTKTKPLTITQKRKVKTKLITKDKQKYVSNKVKKSGKLKTKLITKDKYEKKKAKYAKKGRTLGTTKSVASQTLKKGDKKSVSRLNITKRERDNKEKVSKGLVTKKKK